MNANARSAAKRIALALCVCTTIVAGKSFAVTAAPVSEDVPVAGGIAAVAEAIGIPQSPEAARFAAELPRIVYNAAEAETTAPRPRRLVAYFRSLPADTSSLPVDVVPVPLTIRTWSDVVFRRPVAAGKLIEEILTNRPAALLCRGLAGLDDETLAFLTAHPATLRHIYEHDTAAFAAFADALRISAGRVVVPGGEQSARLWEAVVGAPATRPDAFIDELFSRDKGRVAYLYATIAHLDAPHRSFALGSTLPESSRLERFKALASITAQMCPEWDVRIRPFTRSTYDVSLLLAMVRVREDGAPAAPASKAFWAHAFEVADSSSGGGEAFDAAWLAQQVVTEQRLDRQERFEQLGFGQRVLASGAGTPEAPRVVADYRRFPMLMLALERAGVTNVATYASADAHAQKLTADSDRGIVALTEFQGAISLITRAVRVGTFGPTTAEGLINRLTAVPIVRGEYAGGVAGWLRDALLPALRAQVDAADAAVESALAGVTPDAAPRVVWEDRTYRVDLAEPERRRLHAARGQLNNRSVTRALELYGQLSAESDRKSAKATALARQVDDELAGALRTLAYAADIGDPDSTIFFGGDVGALHDFGMSTRDHAGQANERWAEPHEDVIAGQPWHLAGSLLNLDVALAPLALHRMDTGHPVQPLLNSNERDTFAKSVALMNPQALHDADLDTIASSIARGRARVLAARSNDHDLDQVASSADVDGWRRRAMRWAQTHGSDPLGYFSLGELMGIGSDGISQGLDAWGMSARQIDGCLCTRLYAPPRWMMFEGRPQFGLLATQTPDLGLAVAVGLHDRRLPAFLARGVLARAAQDYIDEVRPSDDGDWLTMARAAQTIDPNRFDDYVAALTANGPLVPERASARPPA